MGKIEKSWNSTRKRRILNFDPPILVPIRKRK